MQILGLGYVGVAGPDLGGFEKFLEEIAGLMPTAALADGGRAFAADARRFRVAAYRGEKNALAYVGFEVADARALSTAVDELRGAGIAVRDGSADERSARAVAGLAVLADPAGHRLELFHGAAEGTVFASPAGVPRFVTGGLGLGHVNLVVPELEPALRFYRERLGFRDSDWMDFGPGIGVHFLHCGPRHHSLAVTCVGPLAGLHHLMLEVPSVDDVGRAWDRAHAAKAPISAALGRHSNDGMFSFYAQTPLGFHVEIGCQGRLLDETWRAGPFLGDIWGHEGLAGSLGTIAGGPV
jgi:3,4-dihydroxy-9,10-secoandrosta-1,3,5(10)-triene-9,17-dione 4,5-dioxygenase